MTQVIIVDDDLTNVHLTQMLLEMDGFEAIGCTNLAQAQAASTPQTSAFVVDVNLVRGESGLDLARMVRAGETSAATDTIVIVTSGDHRREKEALEIGADQFLLKPYPPDSLSELLNNFIERKANG